MNKLPQLFASSLPKMTDRRRFLKVSAGAIFVPYWASATHSALGQSPNSASDKVVVGCIGVGGRGMGLVWEMLNLNSMATIAAVADVDSGHLQWAQKVIAESPSSGEAVVDGYRDYRRILERKDIDAVVIATPEHWHAKIAIEAMQAGKDVYCEKPLSLTIDEGRRIVRAQQETGKVFQVGTQQRSMEVFPQAVALARAGRLGDIRKMTVSVSRAPTSERLPVAEAPASLDWDMWLGQCPKVDYRFGEGLKRWTGKKADGDGGENASNGHYEFRWWYAFSAGKLTDWGAHHIDICHWLLDQNGPGQGALRVTPTKVVHSVPFDDEGNPTEIDRYNVATEFDFLVEFPGDVEVTLTSEGRNGLLVEGTEGRIFVNRSGIHGQPVKDLADNPLPEDAVEQLRGKDRSWDHMQDFVDCVRSRKTPISDVASHHRALTTCHLAAIASRLNRSVEWDPTKETIVGDAIAQSMESRPQRKGYEIPA